MKKGQSLGGVMKMRPSKGLRACQCPYARDRWETADLISCRTVVGTLTTRTTPIVIDVIIRTSSGIRTHRIEQRIPIPCQIVVGIVTTQKTSTHLAHHPCSIMGVGFRSRIRCDCYGLSFRVRLAH